MKFIIVISTCLLFSCSKEGSSCDCSIVRSENSVIVLNKEYSHDKDEAIGCLSSTHSDTINGVYVNTANTCSTH